MGSAMDTDANAAVVRRYLEAFFGAGDAAVAEAIVAPDAVFREPAQVLDGRAALVARQAEFHRAFPGLRCAGDEVVAGGERVAARWTMTGTHAGPFGAFPQTGRPVTLRGIGIYRLAGGRIVEVWGCHDTLGAARQLGATVTPPGRRSRPRASANGLANGRRRERGRPGERRTQTGVREMHTQPMVEVAGARLEVLVSGAGNSSPALSPDDLSMRRLADDLDGLRRRLGYERWVVAGFSAGGYVGLLYAVTYSDSLQGLILAATAPSGRFRYDPDCVYNPARAYHAQFQAERDRALGANATPDDVPRWAQLVYHNPDVVERHVRAAEARAGRWSDTVSNLNPPRMAAMRAQLEGTGGYARYDVTDRLGQIRAPTLILGGRHDVSNPIRWSRVLHEGILGSELVVFEDSGHLLWEEEPEKFRDAILGFMQRIA